MSDAQRSVSQMIVNFLRERDADIDVAIEVEQALKSLRVALAEEIGQRIADAVRRNLQGEWEISDGFSHEQYSGLTFRRASWPSGKNSRGDDCSCWVGFQFESWNWKNAKFGVAAHREILTEASRSQVAESIRKEFPDLYSQDEWWPARHRNLDGIPSDWLSDEFLSFARRIKRGDKETRITLAHFIGKLIRIGDIVDHALTKTEGRAV